MRNVWRILLALLTVVVWAAIVGGDGSTLARALGDGGLQGEGAGAVKFVMLDVMVDSGKVPLAAYQVEFAAPAGVSIVGLEGGEAAPFKEAPFYDPAALMGNRIIVAAFSTAEALPAGNVCVARLHLMASGVETDALLKMTNKLVVATDAQGQAITARLSLRTFQGEKR